MFLQVPPSKNFKSYVKPVAAVVKDKTDAWLLQLRPTEQAALWDRIGEKVAAWRLPAYPPNAVGRRFRQGGPDGPNEFTAGRPRRHRPVERRAVSLL